MEIMIILFTLVTLLGVAGVGSRGRKMIKKHRATVEVARQESVEAAKEIKKNIESIRKI